MGKRKAENASESKGDEISNLSSKLFDSSRNVDSELDAIFQINTESAEESVAPVPSSSSPNLSKRKGDKHNDSRPDKRKKISADSSSTISLSEKKKKKKDKKSGNTTADVSTGVTAEASPRPKSPEKSVHITEDVSSSSDQEYVVPLHESIVKPKISPKKRTLKVKYAPEGETKEDIDARTVFVGNLHKDVVNSKSSLKGLKRHLMSFVPSSALAKVESTRFRSVGFNSPSGDSSKDNKPESSNDVKETTAEPSSRSARQRDRTASWKETAEETKSDAPKVYLKPSEKKKIAFIHKDLNEKSETVNCYVVFSHHPPTSKEEAMHPAEVAKLVVEGADGTTFMDRTIRVDCAGGKGVKARGSVKDDMKRTVFVGNLDFEATEETLRAFFEATVKAEKGISDDVADDAESDSDEEGDTAEPSSAPTSKPSSNWVTYVRVVRDKDTQLGKGFAYIQFKDQQTVDEILALEEGRLKFAKRKLRVQRCKTIPGGSLPSQQKAKLSSEPKTKSPSKSHSIGPTPIAIPKGDPALGDRLVALSKPERKQVKSSDPGRVARRLAKKKAKAVFDKQNSKNLGKVGMLGKTGAAKTGKKSVGLGKKARVRSDRAVERKNVKK